ncbi:rab11 family-interacting protein 1, partial [Biomphalaria pfeifferi]
LRARNLIAKGKGGNNDVFVTIQLGKEKYQTSTIKNALNPEWFEECDLPIASLHSEIEVSLFHHGVLSDDFLGYVAIPLWEQKVTETPKSSWVSLHAKPNSKSGDTKYRGELEIKLTFHSQAKTECTPHGLKKRSSSIRNLATAFGDKFKFVRSRSLRENRRETEAGKMNKHRGVSSPDAPETASLRGIPPYAHSPVHFSALDISRAPWGIDPSAPDTLTRSYSMSAAYIKSMSLDRNKSEIYSVSTNVGNKRKDSSSGGGNSIKQSAPPPPGVAASYSQSMYNLPGNRRSCTEIPLRQPPPLPYDLRLSSKDDCSLRDLNDRRAKSEFHINSTSRPPPQPLSGFFDSGHRTELSGIYESIRERTEPENSASSSSSDPESVPMPRPRRYLHKDGRSSKKRTGEQNEINGRDSGILEDRSSSHGNSLEGSSINDGTANNGSKSRSWTSAANDENLLKKDEDRNKAPANNSGYHFGDKDLAINRTGRAKKKVSVPSQFYSKENSQGELVVRKRSRGQRDRLRHIRQGNRRYTVQGLDNHNRLYDDSLSSEPSDTSRAEVPEDMLSVFKNMSKEDLFRVVIQCKAQMIRKDQYIKDLENYIDDLLVRVMEATPKLLSRPGMHR